MQRFFNDFEVINTFTLSLGFHKDRLECAHCSKPDQFVSHGIIYKQRSSTLAEKVGKRIFCSNRYGRRGCGRTFQLYVSNEVPTFRYGAAHLFVFIASVLAQYSVKKAYFAATGKNSFRNAWRWINRLVKQMSTFRSFLKSRPKITTHLFQDNVQRFQVLLPPSGNSLSTLSQTFVQTINCRLKSLLFKRSYCINHAVFLIFNIHQFLN